MPISNEITTTIQRIQREFLWNSNNGKVKHKTISKDFQSGSLKNVNIFILLAYSALGLVNYTTKTNMTGNWFQCILLTMLLGKTSVLHQLPTFYTNIFQSWKRNFSYISYTPSCIRSQFLWFNNYITIDNSFVHCKEFLSDNINFISQSFTSEGEFKGRNHFKREFWLTDNLYCKFMQLSQFLKSGKKILRENRVVTCAIYLDHQVIEDNLLFSLKKLKSWIQHWFLKKVAYPLYSSILTLYSQI